MKYRNAIIALGAAVVVVQFLGFPTSWDDAIYAVLGLLVVALGYLAGKAPKPEQPSAPASNNA